MTWGSSALLCSFLTGCFVTNLSKLSLRVKWLYVGLIKDFSTVRS